MADGETTRTFELTLSDLALAHLKTRAEKLGMTLDAAAAEVIGQNLFDDHDYDCGDDPENDPRTATLDAFDPTGLGRPAEVVLDRFRRELEKRLAARGGERRLQPTCRAGLDGANLLAVSSHAKGGASGGRPD